MEFGLSLNGVYICVSVCMCEMDRFLVSEKEREKHSSLIIFFFFIGHLLSSWQTIVLRSAYAHNKAAASFPMYSAYSIFLSSILYTFSFSSCAWCAFCHTFYIFFSRCRMFVDCFCYRVRNRCGVV